MTVSVIDAACMLASGTTPLPAIWWQNGEKIIRAFVPDGGLMLKLLNRWIPARIRRNDDLLLRSYLLLAIILANTAISLAGAVIFWFFVDLPADIDWIPHVFLDGGAIGYLAILALFIITGSYVVASHAVVLMLLLMVYAAIAITGGFTVSVMTILCFLSPAMAFLLTGLRSGVTWLLLTGALSTASVLAQIQGVEFLSLLPAEFIDTFRVALHYVMLFMLGGSLMIYELINQRLKQTLSEEKNRFQHIATLATDSTVVTASADALAVSADSMLVSSEQQKASIEALVTTAGHLNAAARHNNSVADSTKHAIGEAGRQIDAGKAYIGQLLDAMTRVQASGTEIQSINNVISEISRQTHLLSINAMIEAARSSAQGSGFKVVALEVRRLAESAAKAAQEINVLLEGNLHAVQGSLQLTDQMHRSFDEMTGKIQPLIVAIQEIATASHDQSLDIQQIVHALEEMDSAVNDNRQRAGQTATLAAELRANAQRLLGLLECS